MDVFVHGRLTTVRPATEADADMLVAWHADPEVARFWDDETFTRDEMVERLRRRDVEAFVIEAAGEPVGYVQAWTDDGTSGGMDMFLVPSSRGRGLGPDVARTLATYLIEERGWSRVTVDPYKWNERAVRAWERGGFVTVGEGEPDEDHTAPWWLMEFQSLQGGPSPPRRDS